LGQIECFLVIQSKVGAHGYALDHRLPDGELWLWKAQDEIHAPDDRRTEPSDVVDDSDRRNRRSLEEPVHKHLAAASAEGSAVVEVKEKIIRFVDYDDRPSRHTASLGDGDTFGPAIAT
jgi:hypothetical protein